MNKEERRTYNKAYYQDHFEEMKVQQKAYREDHKEARKTYNKAWREAHPGYYEKHNRVWRKSNPEKMKAKGKAWRKSNPEKHREKSRRRRALERTTEIESINDKIVYLRDGWICQICKKRVDKRFKHPNPMSPSLDHVIPLNKGGSHTYKNVQLAHLSCNVNKNVNVLPQGEQLRIF